MARVAGGNAPATIGVRQRARLAFRHRSRIERSKQRLSPTTIVAKIFAAEGLHFFRDLAADAADA